MGEYRHTEPCPCCWGDVVYLVEDVMDTPEPDDVGTCEDCGKEYTLRDAVEGICTE